MQKLPAVVKARATRRHADELRRRLNVSSTSFSSPEDTFGVLRDSAAGAREPAELRA